MKVLVFSAKPYDRQFLSAASEAQGGVEFHYLEVPLRADTRHLVSGYDAVCAFVNDCIDALVLQALAEAGIRLIAMRCAGYNNIDLKEAARLGITIMRVPAYSPHAVAEHAVALMLALNRKIHRAYNRVREGNFLLNGLLGFDMYQRTVGIVGTGRIGEALSRIMLGFGCRVIAHDVYQNPACLEMGVEYVDLDTLLAQSDIISLHCPLTPETRYLVNAQSVTKMKRGVMIINTGRGALIDTQAVIDALKSGQIGYLGLDVYEQEDGLFFEDLSSEVIQDDMFERLMTFHNVIITGHQGFFTHEALENIAHTTVGNIRCYFGGTPQCENVVRLPS